MATRFCAWLGAAWAGRRIRLVDGTVVSEPGATGSQWRLHYSIRLSALNCEEAIVTPTKQGETLKRFEVRAGDVLIGHRGYAHPDGITHVVANQADVIIRTNLVTLPLYDAQGVRLHLLPRLRGLSVGEYGDWQVWVKSQYCSV